jgi:hypothetical protein
MQQLTRDRGQVGESRGGWTASVPIRFDAKQWRRYVRTAKGCTPAPGAVPLRVCGGRISVGGTIRAIGQRWHPVFTLPYAPGACTWSSSAPPAA